MAIIKKRKAAGFKTREEFEAAVDRMAKLYVQVQKDEAQLKMRHQQLDDKYQPEIKAQKDEISELYDNAEVYFKEHASDLCKPGTKQGETKLAFFGVKIGMPTVVKNIRDAWKAVAARWSKDGLLQKYIRATPEIDKDGILAVFRDEKRVDEQNLIRKCEQGDTATRAFFKTLAAPLPKEDHLREIYKRLKAKFEPQLQLAI